MRFGQGGGLVQVADDDDGAVVAPAGPGDGAAVQRLQPLVDRGGDGLAKGGIRGDQDRLRAFVVFGLAEQVERDPVGVVVAVGDHEDFRRPGDHVDADAAEDPALGGGDIGIAGAGDLVDRGDRLRCRRPARQSPARRRCGRPSRPRRSARPAGPAD